MSFPGSGLETTYRNNLREVAKMLQTNHQDKYMVRGGAQLGHGGGGGGGDGECNGNSWLASQPGGQGVSQVCLPGTMS